MAYYGEYTTVNAVRSTYLATSGTGDDTLILELIRDVSRTIELICGERKFAPRIETRSFDVPSADTLYLDDDLLAVTTLLNGDATTITANQYWLNTANQFPKWSVELKPSSNVGWQYDSSGESKQVIALAGTWGYHRTYTTALETLTTLGAAMNTTATSATLAAGAGNAGDLLKIDSEYLYLSARVSTTATVVRAANGSTAATHDNGATISRWVYDAALTQLAREAVAAKYRLRENPIGETIVIDGQSFATPKDVDKYIKARLEILGLVRL